jgi:hypothetical protein
MMLASEFIGSTLRIAVQPVHRGPPYADSIGVSA